MCPSPSTASHSYCHICPSSVRLRDTAFSQSSRPSSFPRQSLLQSTRSLLSFFGNTQPLNPRPNALVCTQSANSTWSVRSTKPHNPWIFGKSSNIDHRSKVLYFLAIGLNHNWPPRGTKSNQTIRSPRTLPEKMSERAQWSICFDMKLRRPHTNQ